MREIKFRGERIDNDEWVCGDLTRYSEEMSYITVDLLKNEVYRVHTETVGQYIELKDTNGVEVYEGDIVECYAGEHYHGIWEYQKRFVVEFGWTQSMWEMLQCDRSEVIGNIYDNPELMGVKND